MSDVNRFAHSVYCATRRKGAVESEQVHAWVEARLEDVGDHALMRGLDTALPNSSPEAFPVLLRASTMSATKHPPGIPLSITLPPLMRAVRSDSLVRSGRRFGLSCDGPH